MYPWSSVAGRFVTPSGELVVFVSREGIAFPPVKKG